MKIVLAVAYVSAVTNLMLSHGEDLVPAIALKLQAEVEPKLLEELRAGLTEKFFEAAVGDAPRVPCIPELAALTWKTEYEKGTLTLGLTETEGLAFKEEELRFTGVDTKAISFEPLATGRLAFECNAIIRADEDGRGKLTALLKHNVKATFSKLTQKPLAEPKKPADDAASTQQVLPEIHPLIPNAPETQH